MRRLAAVPAAVAGVALGGLARADEGSFVEPPAENLWRPAPPPRYGAWPEDFKARQRRDRVADRRAADATAAAEWADRSAGGVVPTVLEASTGPTGGPGAPPSFPPLSNSFSIAAFNSATICLLVLNISSTADASQQSVSC